MRCLESTGRRLRKSALSEEDVRASLSKARLMPKTRFLVDENIRTMGRACHAVQNASTCWIAIRAESGTAMTAPCLGGHGRLGRFLITHDDDFLHDRLFPYNQCSGLLVMPTFGSQSAEFARLVSASTEIICKGHSFWFHTKHVVSRSLVMTTRSWDKSIGQVMTWTIQL